MCEKSLVVSSECFPLDVCSAELQEVVLGADVECCKISG